MVNWAITGKCNLRCKHCYGEYGESQTDEISLDIIKKTIIQLKKMGTKRINIEGGEPLFRKDVEEILYTLKEQNIESSLCTNGIYIENHIKTLKECCDLIIFSMDGQEKYHDALRGKHTFKKTIDALKIAKKHHMRTLLFTCLIDDNIEDIDALIEIAYKYQTFITFNIAVSKLTKTGTREELNKVQDQKYKEAIQKIINYKKKGAPIYYSHTNLKQALNWPTFKKETFNEDALFTISKKEKKTMIPCQAGKKWIYIECDGNVYPCYQLVKTIQVKNIAKDGIEEAFKHLSKINYCTRCYNLTLSELNLQTNLNLESLKEAFSNYFIKK